MTKHADRKSEARAYAREHGINYTAALRFINAAEAVAAHSDHGDVAEPPTLMPASLHAVSIQPGALPNGTLPYEFHILPDGQVWQQEFWRGSPLFLIGFTDTAEERRDMSLSREAFLVDPRRAVGKFAVMRERGGAMASYRGAIESITERDLRVDHPVRATFHATVPGGPLPIDFDVSTLLAALSDEEIRDLWRSGWSNRTSDDLIFDVRWRDERLDLVADWAEDIRSEEEDTDEQAMDRPRDGFRVALDVEQADAWLAKYLPHVVPQRR